MKTAKMLQNLIEKTAQEFEFDLSDATVMYRLEDKFGDTITVTRKVNGLLCIGEYKDFQDGKLTGDPEFLFFTEGSEWMPVGFSQRGSDPTWGTVISTDESEFISVIPQIQDEIAEKCRVWTHELMERNDYDGVSRFLIPVWLT
jgi:hypothetical protein